MGANGRVICTLIKTTKSNYANKETNRHKKAGNDK